MICRKATVALPDANFPSPWCQSLSSRAQNRGFCALLGSGTLVFGHFEHKIEFFVRFCQRDELNEQDKPNELNERDKQDKKNGRVR